MPAGTAPGAEAQTPSYPGTIARLPFPGTEDLKASDVFSGPGYQAPQPRTSPWAVAGLVLALISLVPGAGLLAAVAGTVALRRMRLRYQTGQALAWFAIVVGLAACVFWIVVGLVSAL